MSDSTSQNWANDSLRRLHHLHSRAYDCGGSGAEAQAQEDADEVAREVWASIEEGSACLQLSMTATVLKRLIAVYLVNHASTLIR